MGKLSVKDLPVKGRKVFLRVDFNVPLDDHQRVTDDTRIRASLPTIKYLLEQQATLIIASHLGRPKGKVDPKYSLAPAAERLEQILQRKVFFAPDCVGPKVKEMLGAMKPGDVLVLENLRFHAEEEKNDPTFARELASLADYYVNDAFGSAHRAHASVEAIAHNFKDPACGFLMEKEINYLDNALKNPKRPLVAIIGGAKVSTKIGVLKNLLNVVDEMVVGGGMCFTLYKAKGLEIGRSLCENDFLDKAKELLASPRLLLPQDVVVAPEPKPGSPTSIVLADQIPADQCGVDIGPAAVSDISVLIGKAGTIIWNGPMGIFEIPEFSAGTKGLAKAVADATTKGAVSIVGGGDTVAALAETGLTGRISHVSTGGGASLEFLEGIVLPGVKALKDRS